MPPTVPSNDFRRQWRDTRDAMLAAFEAVGESGRYILGGEVGTFEIELARAFGVPRAVGVASGLDAIEISLRVLGCGPGDKVLTTPLSAFATTLAIVKTGALPVFADTDAHGLIDLDACEEALRDDPRIQYFVPVHLYGHSLDLPRLAALRDRYGLAIVEDCAQSIGARWRGQPAGSIGQLSATSFYPTKNLGAMGDGGAILARDEHLARAAAEYRDYGRTAACRHERIGYNSRLDELQAALLRRVGLPKLAEWTARRRVVARAYVEGIANPAIRVPGAPAHSESVWHLFPVLVDPERKPSFLEYLRGAGVAAGEHYPTVIFDQPAMAAAPHQQRGPCAAARAFCRGEVSLPVHPYLDDEQVAHVIATCNGWGG